MWTSIKRALSHLLKVLPRCPRIDRNAPFEEGVLIVDTRPKELFKKGHIKGAMNIQDGGKFETWLGSIIGPMKLFT